MPVIQSWYPDYLAVWGLSVLLQATLAAAVALLVARCMGRGAAPRHGVLLSAMVLLLMIPFVAPVAALCGWNFFPVSFAHAPPGVTPGTIEAGTTESLGAGVPDHSSVETPPMESRDVAESTPHSTESASKATVAGAIRHEPRTQAGAFSLPSPVRISMAALLAVWCVGASVLLLRLCRAWWKLARIIRTAEPVAAGWLDEVIEEVCRDLGVSQAPRIFCSPRVQSFGVGGIWRPIVLLPMGIWEQASRAQLRDILVHEFAHVIRRDSVVVLLQNLVAVLYWPHPLVRSVNRLLACTREEICDNHVLATTDAPSYSRTLLRFAELVPDHQAMPAMASLLASQWKLESRIAAILDEGRNKMTRLSKLQFVSVFMQFAVLVVLTVGGTITLADDVDPEVQKWLAALGTKEEVRFQALNKLIQLGDSSIEPTREVLNDTSQPFTRRWQAAMVLGGLKAKAAVPDLLKIVEGDDHLVVTRVAAEQLGRIGDPSVAPRLKKALDKHSDPLLRQMIEKSVAILESRQPLTAKTGPTNLDFETHIRGIPTGWGGSSKGYRVSVDTENVHQGGGSGRIERIGAGAKFGTVVQSIPAKVFVGKRIKYSGFLRTKEAEGVGLWMRIDAVVDGISRPLEFNNMHDRSVEGTTDWAEHAIVLDVPQEAGRITFGFLIGGDGIVWGDDLKIEIVGELREGPETTGLRQPFSQPASNLDFEAGTRDGDYPKRWSPGGHQTYRLSVDTKTVHQGGASARMEYVGERRSGTMMQVIGAKQYRGKRIRYSGFLRTSEVTSASLWMRIDGIVDGIRKPLEFDNMHNRGVKGTSNWTELTIVLDVPQESQNITLGVMASGGGTVWADDLKIDVVGNLGEGPGPTGIDMRQRNTSAE